MDDLNDVTKQTTLIEELSELIEKKRAENKLLEKLREAATISENDLEHTPDADIRVKAEN